MVNIGLVFKPQICPETSFGPTSKCYGPEDISISLILTKYDVFIQPASYRNYSHREVTHLSSSGNIFKMASYCVSVGYRSKQTPPDSSMYMQNKSITIYSCCNMCLLVIINGEIANI